MVAHPLPTGYILGKRYHIERRIGSGGIGVVYEARDLETDQLRAIKVLHAKGALDEIEGRRFLSEAVLAQRLQHPNIVQVIDVIADKGRPVAIVMELLRGRDLAQALKPRLRFPVERATQIIYSVCCALGHAHAVGIVHRDVKLENIFLHLRQLESGELVEEVKLIDLGLAKSKHTRQVALTMKGYVMGTPLYMAPETTLGVSSLVDELTDQWAVGVVTYRMLSGRFPFERRPNEDSDYPLLMRIQNQPPVALRAVAPDLPEYVYQAIAKALAKKKQDRFTHIDDFARALRGLPPSFQGMSELAAKPGDCVPIARGELPTRAIRFHVPQRDRTESSPYHSLRVEQAASERRGSRPGSLAVPPANTRLPVEPDDLIVVSPDPEEGAGEDSAAAHSNEEEEEEAEAALQAADEAAGKPQPGIADRPSRDSSAGRNISIVGALCLGAAVAAQVTAVVLTRQTTPDGPTRPHAPDASTGSAHTGDEPGQLLSGTRAAESRALPQSQLSSLPAGRELPLRATGTTEGMEPPFRAEGGRQRKKSGRAVVACTVRSQSLPQKEKGREPAARPGVPPPSMPEPAVPVLPVGQPPLAAARRITIVD